MTIIDNMLFDGPAKAKHLLVLAHGAGAPMDSPFMTAFAAGLGRQKIRVVRFEFPYMQRRRAEGTRRPPDRGPKLEQCWREVVSELRSILPKGGKLIIGGKSMGGRIASMVAADHAAKEAGVDVDGVVCLGYPFHPPGRPEKTRTEHLANLTTPTLIVQGTRDALGTFDDVAAYDLPAAIQFCWMEDGDHSFKPRKASGRNEAQNWQEGIAAVGEFVKSL